jgi:hypothetical protein
MAVRKAEEKNIRKLARIGKQSVGVTLPIEDIRALGWREGQKLSIKRTRGGFQVKDWRPASR